MTSVDPTATKENSRRFALIIATSEYKDTDLQKLIAPGKDAESLAQVLENTSIGGYYVKILLNEPKSRIEEEIETFFSDRKRDDLLLLYFSCHGIKDKNGLLYYATANTSRKLLGATAVSSNFVNNIIQHSMSRQKILLIDCCYSGAFDRGYTRRADKEIHTSDYLNGGGTFVITASDAMQYSFEGDILNEEKSMPSVFTRSLIDGLNSGQADHDKNGLVTPEELYEYVYEHVTENTAYSQTPQRWAYDVKGDIVIAKNPYKKNAEEEELLERESILRLLQEGKIDEFNKLRKTKDIPLYFQKVDLSEKDLAGADLHNVDFTEAKLINAKLRMANFNGATLRGADLTAAVLTGADLYRADLSEANLTRADLRNADLKGMIDFKGANLTGANLKGADLKGIINFDGSILYDTDFTAANIDARLVSFKGAKIHNAIGLSDDLLAQKDNKFVKELKAFSKAIEKQLNIYDVGPEEVKPIEKCVRNLGLEIEDIDEYELADEKLSDTKKQNIETKLIGVLEIVINTLPKTDKNIYDIFASLNIFGTLIGKDVQQIVQDILQKEKDAAAKSVIELDKKGSDLYAQKRYNEAIECYDKALTIDSNYVDAWRNKGLSLSELGRYYEAITCYEKVLQLRPKYVEAINNLGLAFAAIGDYEKALESFNQSTDLNPNDAIIWNHKGLTFHALGNYRDAIGSFDKAISLNPTYTEALNNRELSSSQLEKKEQEHQEQEQQRQPPPPPTSRPKIQESADSRTVFRAAVDPSKYPTSIKKETKSTTEPSVPKSQTSSLKIFIPIAAVIIGVVIAFVVFGSGIMQHAPPPTVNQPSPSPVNPEVNHQPIATDQSVLTSMDKPIDITLAGTDSDTNDRLIATIVANPLHGILSAVNQNTGDVTYAPNQGFTGNDSFTFRVNDGKVDSSIGLVRITVENPPISATNITSPSSQTNQQNVLAGNYHFITKWGSKGTGDGQFNGGKDIAVDSSRNVYATDFNNNRVQKFDSNGNFITKWGSKGTGDGQFNGAASVAVDSSGNVYVSDLNNNRIQKFDSNGKFITKRGSDFFGSIAIDPSDNMYVASSINNRVQKFDSNGNFITKWGSKGTGDGQFNSPYGIAVDSSGNVYVADTDNGRVQKFDSNGKFITKWGSIGTGDGKFAYPDSLAVDSLGNVYVGEAQGMRAGEHTRIQVFAPQK